jgi:hypothetical protein
MTHEAREKFHGVPRIIDDKFIETLHKTSTIDVNHCDNLKPNFLEEILNEVSNEGSELLFTKMYLQGHRINMNIRQVF